MTKSKTKQKVHYAWFVCVGCAILLFCTSGLAENAFTIYQPYIMELNGFTNAQTSSILTFRTSLTLITMLLSGIYYKKLSLRTGMTVAGFSSAAGFALFGAAKSYAAYCLAAAFVGIGYGLGTMIPIGIVLHKWFIKSRNTAIGICSAATGLATLGIPSLISYSIEKNGLGKTFYVQSAFMAVLIFISFLLVRSSPEDKNMSAYGENTANRTYTKISGGLTNKQTALLLPAVILVGGVMSVAYCHISVHITSAGYSPSVAALASSFSGIAMMLGKISYGKLGDKITTYKSNYIFASLLVAGLFLNCIIDLGTWAVFASSVIFSFGIAFTSVGLTVWAVDLSAPESREKNIRLFQTLYSVGTLAFSALPGITADKNGGSYVLSFFIFGVLGIYVFATVQYCYKKSRNVI